MRTLIVLIILVLLIMPGWFGARYLAAFGVRSIEFIIIGFAILVLYAFVRLVKGVEGANGRASANDDDSDRVLVREIGRMVENMESRIDVLETILSEKGLSDEDKSRAE